jgi:hypothetical protein
VRLISLKLGSQYAECCIESRHAAQRDTTHWIELRSISMLRDAHDVSFDIFQSNAGWDCSQDIGDEQELSGNLHISACWLLCNYLQLLQSRMHNL